MLADRKVDVQALAMEIPPHKGGSKPSNREVRDANAPASPQPQQNVGQHYPRHHPQHQPPHHHQAPYPYAHPQHPQYPQSQSQHQPHQQHKGHPTHPRRGSTDRGGPKDSAKSKSSTPKPAPEHVGPYSLGKTLGKGSSGCVKLARHRKTNEQVAVKIISKASLANKAAVHRGIEREIAIMKLIKHPHVIRLYDVYETEKELFLVMEYVSGGELFEYLVNKGRLEEAEALRFFQQIIVGLAFCHKRKICHRDLKPENLLLDDCMNVKIADFGMASLQKSGRLLETSCGSPHYASPEVVTGLKYDGSSSDIWSCGIILYALLTGHLPFDDENIRQLLSKVKAGKFYMPMDISPGARDLISRMLTVNPKRRITMQGVMMHSWFRMVNPDRNTLGEPAEDPESGRPLLAEELDAEIILHMRWLFAPGPSHSDPEAKEVFDEEALLREIEEKMTNSSENMEKLFYHLLCQHKMELLENYTGDDNDLGPDGPRRRADSFPNSATASARSHTPDLSQTSRSQVDSPLNSPRSPVLPLQKVSSVEPSPLSLNPLEAAVARAASAAKIAAAAAAAAARTSSHAMHIPAQCVAPPSSNSSKSSSRSPEFAKVDSSLPDRELERPITARSMRRGQEEDYESSPTAAVEKPGSPIQTIVQGEDHPSDVTADAEDDSETIATSETAHSIPSTGGIDQPEETSARRTEGTDLNMKRDQDQEMYQEQQAPVSSQPEMIAPKPISPVLKRISIVSDDESRINDSAAPEAHPGVTEDESVTATIAKDEWNSGPVSSQLQSIENQVVSTEISEVNFTVAPESLPDPVTVVTAAAADRVEAPQPAVSKESSAKPPLAPDNTIIPADTAVTTKSKPQRPLLHPLDVKASAGTTTMSVSVSQHSRKYSEGTASIRSASPLSPSGPKRPWFARLFDFKPQPLAFRSHWSAAETQERVESILKELFHSGIQLEPYKKPSFGIKCRFEGGVIDKQPAKPVKFRIDIVEKTGSFASSASIVSNHSSTSTSSAGSNIISSSALAAILASVDLHHYFPTNQSNGQLTAGSHLPVRTPEGSVAPGAGRRASDGGSILSSAAAAMSTSLAAATTARNPLQHLQHHHQHHQSYHMHHHSTGSEGGSPITAVTSQYGCSPLQQTPSVPQRVVKVTLNQQQGANSTLKIIFEKLLVVWEQQAQFHDQQWLVAAITRFAPQQQLAVGPQQQRHNNSRRTEPIVKLTLHRTIEPTLHRTSAAMSGDKDQEDLPALNQLSINSEAATVGATTMTADPEGASKDDDSQDSAGIRAQPVSASAPNATFPSSAIGNKLEDVSSGLGKQDQGSNDRQPQDQNQGPGDMTTTSFAHIRNSSSDPSAFTPPSPVSTNPFRRSPSVSPRSALAQPELQLYSQPDSPPELPPPPAYVQIEDSTSLESTPALVADVIDPRTSTPALSPQPPSPVATAEASTSAPTPAEIAATAEQRMPVVRDAEPTTEYVLKPIDWIDPATGIEKRIKIITQNENGPCPLLALCNTLILQGKVAIRPYDRPTIGYGHLLELLADYLLNEDLSESASNSTPLASGTQRVGERVEGEKMTSRLEIESALRLLPHLEHGLDVNVFFKSIRGFESTAELGLFHTFGVELVHGWVVSPVIDPSMYALVDGPAGVTSYNKAVECIVSGDDAGGGLVVENLNGGVSSISNSNHGSNNSFGASVQDANLTNERVSRALVVQEFMNSTKTQLTHYGLHVLQESLPEGHLCAFFRNNHFCTLFKNPMDGNLYTLVTDQSLAHEQSIVWESLVNVDGAGDFLDGLFRHGALEIGDYARNNQPLDSQHSTNGDGGGDEE
ncbi:hypothetical protein KVV02_004733 [Mortierella alpina]|uniref:Protein kinase domain-containing protein n=1 Tax=Mortierella alpina TaxID=64518 RepID=A0A9P8A7V9_MORAP|nr:hypothetical protein KVV02_004733 [Mortierella alpina]